MNKNQMLAEAKVEVLNELKDDIFPSPTKKPGKKYWDKMRLVVFEQSPKKIKLNVAKAINKAILKYETSKKKKAADEAV